MSAAGASRPDTTATDDFSGKVVIVTGAGSFMASATVERLVARGASVLATDVPASETHVTDLGLGDRVLFVGGDLADDGHLQELVVRAQSDLGGVDFLVNGAATFQDPMLDATQDDWHHSFDVNVIAAARLISLCREPMIARGGGSVVNIASISGLRAQPNKLLYPVTKAALLGLTRNCALLLAPDGIRVNAVLPGWTWSRNIEKRYGSRERADAVAAEFQVMGRMGDPAEVAEAVIFLLSGRASFITGTELTVDGGYAATSPEAIGQAFVKIPVL